MVKSCYFPTEHTFTQTYLKFASFKNKQLANFARPVLALLVTHVFEVFERERNVYLTTHSTHFIYGYMASDIWLRTILIVRKETRCRHIGYSYRLTASVLLYSPSHRQDNAYHGLCYTSRGALAGTRNSPMVHPMKDRSDDPSHHERTLYLWATSRSLFIWRERDVAPW